MAEDVAAPLPDVTLLPGTVVTVDAGAAGATVDSLILHGFQIEPDERPQSQPILIPTSGR